MRTFNSVAEITEFLEHERAMGKSVGFVPTMGALHEGHISLVERSVEENDITVVSIFVNPIQFNNPEDLEKYPRNLNADLQMLEKAHTDAVFVPTNKEMYPEPVTQKYEFGFLSTIMEGKFRPGHFNGVAVVVHKLFDIIRPGKAYFGEKDYQQLMIIKALVNNYNLPVEIIPCPISRESDGLARSSRNARLTEEMRFAAPFIHQQLLRASELSLSMTSKELEAAIADAFEKHDKLELEYFTIADGATLNPIKGRIPENAYGFIAVFAGDIRLIDNIRLI
jgi:pantoate--beta-alanine ligase